MTGYRRYNGDRNSDLENRLRRDSNFVGIITIAQTLILQLVFLAILFVLGKFGIINNTDEYFGLGNTSFLILYSIAYILSIGLPAPITSLIAGRRIQPFSNFDTKKEQPVKFISVILALMAGLAICIIANFVSSYIVYFFSELGLYPPEMPSYVNKDILSLMLGVFTFALLPAILEEMVYRGYILRILRPYGNVFAMIISSLLFALMHGNILQIPFAFIVGLTCSYLVIRTGSIWISIMLHFLNNFMSVLLQYATLFSNSDEQNQQMTMLVFSIIGLTGLVALLILFAINDPLVMRVEKKPQPITASRRAGAFFLAPAMIVSLILSLALTVLTTQWGGGA